MSKGVEATGWFNNGTKQVGDLEGRVNGTNVLNLLAAGVAITGTLSTSGTATVTAGGLVVTAGDLTMTAGNVDMVVGTLDLQNGGAVTQGTSKSTGVTLSTMSGQITTHAAALAAGVEVSFIVTNTLVGANDVIIANVVSGDTAAGEHIVVVTRVASGSYTLTLSNLSGSSASDAIVINVAVIHGAAS
jgi:hypothetical protein